MELETEEEKAAAKSSAEENKGLLDAIRDALGGKVKAVKTSAVLKEHPVALSSDGPVSIEMEKVLKNIIRTRFLYPRVRPYKTENFYALFGARKEAQPIAKQQKGRKARRQKA